MLPDQLVGRGVHHFGLRRVRDIETMIVAVDVNVIPAAGAANLDFVLNLVSGRRGNGGNGKQYQEEFHDDVLLSPGSANIDHSGEN